MAPQAAAAAAAEAQAVAPEPAVAGADAAATAQAAVTCPDDDVPPTKEFSCELQKAWGKCECEGGGREVVGAARGRCALSDLHHLTQSRLPALPQPPLRRQVLAGAPGLLPQHLRAVRCGRRHGSLLRRCPCHQPDRRRCKPGWVMVVGGARAQGVCQGYLVCLYLSLAAKPARSPPQHPPPPLPRPPAAPVSGAADGAADAGVQTAATEPASPATVDASADAQAGISPAPLTSDPAVVSAIAEAVAGAGAADATAAAVAEAASLAVPRAHNTALQVPIQLVSVLPVALPPVFLFRTP